MDDLMTTRDVAALRKVHPITVKKERIHRVGIPYLKDGKNVRYRPEDVEANLQSIRRTSTSQASGAPAQGAA